MVLESSKSLPEAPWEVSIWYDHTSYSGQKSSWQALDLERDDVGPYLLHDDSGSLDYRYIFSGILPSPFTATDKVYKGRRVPFTVRYRIDPNSEWQWVYHNFGIDDGELILQPPVDPNFLGASRPQVRLDFQKAGQRGTRISALPYRILRGNPPCIRWRYNCSSSRCGTCNIDLSVVCPCQNMDSVACTSSRLRPSTSLRACHFTFFLTH